MSRRVKVETTTRARALRSAATRHERKLWTMIARLRPITRQLPIGPYIVDFACREAKLIVELDGSQHAESERDRLRDAWLTQQGWTVLRIWNRELDDNPEGVFDTIVARAAEDLGGTHPQPLPSRKGRKRRSIA